MQSEEVGFQSEETHLCPCETLMEKSLTGSTAARGNQAE